MAWELDHCEGLPYRFLLPHGYDPSRRYPVVLYLHGSAERGDDTRAHLGNGVDALGEHELIAVAPQCPRSDTFGGSWYGGESQTQAKVVALVRTLAGRRSVDPRRISAIGYSMGAIGLWELLLRHRSLFSAAVPIAGDLDPAAARALEGFPIWAFHGEHDELVPNTATRAVAAMLPPPFRYTEIAGVGHDSWRAAFGNPELLPWLLAQKSSLDPGQPTDRGGARGSKGGGQSGGLRLRNRPWRLERSPGTALHSVTAIHPSRRLYMFRSLPLLVAVALCACGPDPELPSDEELADVSAALTTGQRLSLRASNGKFVTVGEGGRLFASAARNGPKERFEVLKIADGVVALKSLATGKFVAAENGGGTHLIANRDEALGWERFGVAHYPLWQITLRSNRGLYVRVLGGETELTATAERQGDLTKLTIVPVPRQVVLPKSYGFSGVNAVNDGLAATGAQIARTNFRWDAHQPVAGDALTTDPSRLKDDFVIQAHARGIKVLGLLIGTPAWARVDDCPAELGEAQQHCAPKSPAEFGRFAGLMARHYKQLNAAGAGVHDWEIMNEVNSQLFFRPDPDPEHYTRLLIAAYNAIKAEDPEANVNMGSTCPLGIYNPTGEPNMRHIDPRIYLQRAYAEARRLGVRDFFDGITYHPYTFSHYGMPIDQVPSWALMSVDTTMTDGTPLKSLHTQMVEAGDGDKPIEQTEWGVPTSEINAAGREINEDEQVAYTLEALDLWKSYPWAGGFYYFNYKDMDTNGLRDVKHHSLHFGAIESTAGEPGCDASGRPTGTAKKLYCAFTRYPKN